MWSTSLHSLIFSVSLHTYITAQYRHVVVCIGLYPVRSQSLHEGYSSGCIESAMQPSSTEKSSRTTLHYVMQNDSACDLVLPPCLCILVHCTHNEPSLGNGNQTHVHVQDAAHHRYTGKLYVAAAIEPLSLSGG